MRINQKTKSNLPTAIKRIIYSALVLVLLTASLVGVAYLLLTQPPKEYLPKVLSKAQQEIADNRFNNKMAEFYNSINRMEPFFVSFDQQTINERLLLDDTQKYLASFQKPSTWQLSQAQVSFEDDTIKLMARITHENITSVLTVSLHPRITELGKLQIKLGAVKAGLLTIPDRVVAPQLQRLKQALQEAGRPNPKKQNNKQNDKQNAIDTKEILDKLVKALSELENQKQVTVDEVFRTQDKETRLLAVKISEGKVELALESSWLED